VLRTIAALLLIACFTPVFAQQLNPSLYAGMRWRMIGPFRGGRTVAISGVPGHHNVFYMAPNDGGVWKTTDYGRTWRPIFDHQPTGSIGALAVAWSDPRVIYVGSGEGIQRPDLSVGDGIYQSNDGGATWKHLGLRDGQQIGSIIVDPHDPSRVFAAVLGHPYGPNPERGVFRSLDYGATWQKVLYKDENTGAAQVAFDPSNAQIVYADLWAARQAPWELAGGSINGPGSGLYKSTDGGTTWHELSDGLPTIAQGRGRIGIGIAPSDPSRIYALVDADEEFGGLYRSDDAGAHWRRMNHEIRIWGRGADFACVVVDPRNRDVVYVANTSTYRSDDGGAHFTAIKGAPGGDDYHTIWIHPEDPNIIALAVDQGATISVNGGKTWSSWYNQPTAQFYHVITDNRFPYWVYGGQQESGSAAVASRSDYGEITFRDFHPVGAEEYGYIAPDPLDPNIVYGGKLTRFNQTTGDVQNISPQVGRGGKYRFVRTAPLIFSPADPHILYYAAQVLFKTTNGGHSWDVISPELTRKSPEIPSNYGLFSALDPRAHSHRGVIYTIAPSHHDVNVIWVGTDDGLIQLTRDGGEHWTDVTPPELTPWSKVSMLDASHFDDDTAYAAINRIHLDDMRPYIYRTHDGGKTWTEIVKGLPDQPVNSVREDPVRKGLLFAATEIAVYVSFNDGDSWAPLRLNMPATSVRDIVIHGDDLVAGTHGRSFWILDDLTPLRQLTAEVADAPAHLYRPQVALRWRWNRNTDTPLPPEEPAGQNPPDGAIIDFYLKTAASTPVTLQILDGENRLVRRYASTDKPPAPVPELNVPTYWIRPPEILPASAGMHRFVWDLHYTAPPSVSHEYPISAIYRNTWREPRGPIALPGAYTVRLTADGRTYTQPLELRMDPRIKTPPAQLREQFTLAMRIADLMRQDYEALEGVRHVRAQLQHSHAAGAAALEARAAALESRRPDSLTGLNRELAGLLDLIDGTDRGPTTQGVAAVRDAEASVAKTLAAWKELQAQAAKLGQ
jgi:photosystem II stability/assembly factor-like uncharacterized protein